MASITKLFFVPLGEFAAPGLLVVHAFEHEGGSAAECHLLDPSGNHEPIVDVVYTRRAQAEGQLVDVALVKAENYVRLMRSRVAKEQLAGRSLEEASFAQLSARLVAGQFPQWSTLPARSRDARDLAIFLEPITPKFALEPLASAAPRAGEAAPLEEPAKRRWPPMLRLRMAPKSGR